jgi:hypothetical protein
VIECRACPVRRGMTRFARHGITRRAVIRIRRVVILCGMTCIASAVRQCVVPVGMARLTGGGDVQSRQRELRRAVIERCRLPCSG